VIQNAQPDFIVDNFEEVGRPAQQYYIQSFSNGLYNKKE